MPPSRRPYLRVAIAVVVLLLGAALYIADARLKHWPGPGLRLANSMLVSADNWPAFWGGLLQTEAGHGVSEALSRQIGAVDRDIRLATGIRPTPLRWSVWLGNRAVYSQRSDVSMLCVRPGLLFRACQALGIAPARNPGGLVNFAWQDGYLLVFFAPNMADGIEPAPDLSAPKNSPPSIVFQLPDVPAPTSIRITASEDLPVEIVGQETESETTEIVPIPLADESDHAIVDLFLDARGRVVFDNLCAAATRFGVPADIGGALAPRVPDALSAALPWDHIALERRSLFEVQFDKDQPILYVGQSICLAGQAWGRHPYETDTLYPPMARIPFDWEGVPGFYLPVLGNDYTFGCAIQGGWAHTANPPGHVADLLVKEANGTVAPPSLRVRVNWLKVADAYAAWRRAKGPDKTGDNAVFEMERNLTPWTDAMRAVGETRLELQPTNTEGHWRITGELARGAS